MKYLNLICGCVLWLHILVTPALAEIMTFDLGKIPLVADAPAHYTVTDKDDLIGVLSRFVEDPAKLITQWKQKPVLHPWDEIALINKDKMPTLQVKRGRTVKLSPTIKSSTEGRTIPTIPLHQVQQFLMRPVVLGEEEIEQSGYIIGNANDSLLTTVGNQVYVRGLDSLLNHKKFVIIRVGTPYVNPEDEDDVLARETLFLGDAELKTGGDPAILTITSAVREIQTGDRLVVLEEQSFNEDFYPHLPNYLDGAKVIAIMGGLTRVAKYQVVVINKGTDDGIEVGHVLAVNHTSGTIVDPHAEEDDEPVTIPSQQVGTLLVFKPYQRVSFALVMRSTSTISVLDEITIP